MVTPTIEIQDKVIQDYLKQVQRKLGDLTPLMKTISETIHTAVQRNFQTEGARLPGGKWQDLADAKKKERRKIGKWPGSILQVNRNLMGGISPDYDSTTAAVGSNMPFKKGYAAIHHFGGKAGRGKGFTMPARPFFELANEDLEDIQQDAVDYLEK